MAEQQKATQGDEARPSSPKGYPHDRFDDVHKSTRTGAHRFTPHQRYAWQFIVGGLIGAVLLTGIGVVSVNFANNAGTLPILPTEAPVEPTVEKTTPALDPEASIVILDGTSATGEVALRLDPIIVQEQWGIVISAGPAASTDVEISAVFYSDLADEAAALGLAQKLGGLSAYQSDEYVDTGARLIVLLGSDYAGPGLTAE